MKKLLLISLFILPAVQVFSQDKFLRRVTPHHAKVQFAGSIGFVSAGLGYENRKRTVEGDIYYGYVPKKFGGVTMHSLTGKFTYYPLKETKLEGFYWRPLSVGVLTSYTFGKQFFLFDPENYPYNYYGFPTALHVGVFAGGQISAPFAKMSLRNIALYYEVGTNDKELKSYLGNNSIPLKDIVNLAIGIKTGF